VITLSSPERTFPRVGDRDVIIDRHDIVVARDGREQVENVPVRFESHWPVNEVELERSAPSGYPKDKEKEKEGRMRDEMPTSR
jgi:hypothetical protein